MSVPRLGYYLGIGDRKAYQDLVNKGSQAFFFFLVPICVGLATVGIPVTLLYGGEKTSLLECVQCFLRFVPLDGH